MIDDIVRNHGLSFLKNQLFLKAPKQEDHELTPALRLLSRRQEMNDIDRQLELNKVRFNQKMESIIQRRAELSRKESQLQSSLAKFDAHLGENDGKKLRAMKKTMDEKSVM